MLIKEYRIPIPLSVDDYQIAQLYMIQKKSREESDGEGSAVEILENHPYEDGPNGSGQYTYKVYHIGRHLPSWFRNIAPKTALEVHEESWNAYPYTKTIFSVPFVDKFSIDIETYFERDGGTQENKFKLKPSEIRHRELDVIDIVNDQLTGSDYVTEEDPTVYTSLKHGRGPLKSDWIKNPPDGVIMCAYKLVKVEFRYWGLQSKVERFIHDYGLRRVMLRAHRQAWAWQDEWVGLTIDDIRILERETQLILQKKLGRNVQEEEENDGSQQGKEDNPAAIEGFTQPSPGAEDHDSNTPIPTTPSSALATPTSSTPSTIRRESLHKKSIQGQGLFERRSSNHWRKTSIYSAGSRKASSTSSVLTEGSESLSRINGPVDPLAHMSPESDEDSTRPEWALDQIELEDSDSDLEFFDAQDTMYGEEDSLDEEDEKDLSDEQLTEVEPQNVILDVTTVESTSAGRGSLWSSTKRSSMDISGDEEDADSSPSPDILFLILHGGSIMDPVSDRVGKSLDFSTLQTNIRTVTELHFRSDIDRIAMRMVPCKNICNLAIQTLCGVSPVPITPQEWSEGLLPTLKAQHSELPNPSNPAGGVETPVLPVGTIPLLATQCHTYQDVLKRVADGANKVFKEFLLSKEGANFSGQVCVIGDCMGAVIGYDILTSTSSSSSSHSHSQGSPCTPPRLPSPQPSPPPPPPPRKTSVIVSPSNYHDRKQTTPMKMKHFSSAPIDKQGATTSLPSNNLSLKLDLGQREPSISSLGSDYSSNTSINVAGGEELSFCFDVSHFFAFGSPLGLILANRKSKSKRTASNPPPRPSSTFFYNLFYGVDHIASRIEPLLDSRFSDITPITVPNYKAFPTGSSEPYTLKDTVVQHPFLFVDQRLPVPEEGEGIKRKAISSECLLSLNDNTPYNTTHNTTHGIKPFSVWWSEHRIDYMLETSWKNEGFERLPVSTFSHIVHSRYWEAKEMASFILRQVLHHDVVCVKQRINGKETIQVPFVPQESVVKWNKKRTSMRISRLRSNHRATDVVALEGVALPPIPAKFQYGPLAMSSLCKEEVEVYKFTQRPTPKWEYAGSELTDKHGKLMFTFPGNKSFGPGLYPIKFLVKGDHTNVSCNIFVVPPHVEAVVFSIDGALSSNFSLSAKDIKLKQGAVEVARSWQELGYLIIYISGRPDLQKDYILNFLGCHGFPLGLVSCADSFSTDSNSVKTAYLGRLIKQAKIIIHVGYGSSRHVGVYKELGLQSDQIYIHGKKTRTRRTSSDDYQLLVDGFAEHHQDMLADPPRKAMHDVREWFGDTCFALPGNKVLGNQKKNRQSKRSAFKSQQSVSIDSTQNGNRLFTPKGRHYLEVNHQTDV